MSAAGPIAEPTGPEPAAANRTTETTRLTRPARKKREPITSLQGFFARRAAKPSSFLKDLREAGIWQFDDDDVRLALESHAERDKDFARTTQLMAAALKEKDGSYAYPVIEFGAVAIRRRLADNPRFIGVDLDAVDDAERRLDLVARALTPRIRESSRRTESANLLLATILWLHHSGGLDSTAAAEQLLSTLDVRPSRSTDRQRARLVWLGERPKELRSVLDLLAPSALAAVELSQAIEAAQRRLEAEQERRETAEAEIARLERSVADLEEIVEQSIGEIARLDELSRAATVHADHDVRQVKARVAGLLDGQLRDLVATIDEALSLDPPRVEVAREKIGVVVRELERQVTWLRS